MTIKGMKRMLGMGSLMVDFMRGTNRTGPGKRTWRTFHKQVGRSKYTPHQGERERTRQARRIARRIA